jgi:hypothetical protein
MMERKQIAKPVLAVALLVVGVLFLSSCNSPQAQQAMKKAIEEGNKFCYVDFGIYRPAQSYDVGGYPFYGPRGIATDDLDGDGNLDLVTADFNKENNYASAFTVLLGDGRGGFPRRSTYPGYAGFYYGLMAVDTGDINGDGFVDLVGAARNYPGQLETPIQETVTPGYAGVFVVFYGNGDGSFTRYSDPRVLDNTVYVVVADMDNDGDLDIVVTYWQLGAVTVLINNGPGYWASLTAVDTLIPGVTYPRSLAVGDFNQDSIPDVAMAPNVGGLVVLLGNGDGTFQTPQIIDLAGWLSFVVTADLNGDRVLDLAVSSTNGPDNIVYVLYGNGDGTFRDAVGSVVGTNPKGLGGLGAADMDKLGNYDLMVANSGDDTVTGLFDTGLGLRSMRSYPVGVDPNSIVTGDFDRNGLTDVAVTNTGIVDGYPTRDTTVTVLLADYVCLPR